MVVAGLSRLRDLARPLTGGTPCGSGGRARLAAARLRGGREEEGAGRARHASYFAFCGGRSDGNLGSMADVDHDPPNAPHVPVLAREVLHSFEGCNLRVFVDATLGAAGHATKILRRHPEVELYVGIDADPDALSLARQKLQPEFGPKIEFVHGNFRQYESLVSAALRSRGLSGGVDGVLADLGVSSMQIDRDERGFSFMREGPLDMRMDPSSPVSAFEVVNSYSEQELGRILREYGEERLWRRIARAVVEERAAGPIETTTALSGLIERCTRSARRGGKRRRGGAKAIHPATRAFQAVRIEVNGELEAIDSALPSMIGSLNPGGRIGIISFHSLEDRRVKRTFLRHSGRAGDGEDRVSKLERYTGIRAEDDAELGGAAGPTLRLLRRKPFVATEEEAERNARSRSAKYRFAEKTG